MLGGESTAILTRTCGIRRLSFGVKELFECIKNIKVCRVFCLYQYPAADEKGVSLVLVHD